jgi:RNA polymerase sigma-70 factor (ECF subfamily)
MSDERARFEAMFSAHYAAVVRYAVRRVGPDGAQEIVAETFLTAWRRLADVPEYALPWLYATARRLVANELRRRDRAARLGARIEASSAAVTDDPAEAVADQLRVRAALATLSPTDQEVLRLSEWEQLRPADAAIVVGCSVGAFTVRLHRARQRLARALGEQPDSAIATLITDGGPA